MSGWISTPLPCVGAPPQVAPSLVVTMPEDPKVVSKLPSIFRRATATLVPVMSELATTILPFGWSAMSPRRRPVLPTPSWRRETPRSSRASRIPGRHRSSCRACRSGSSAPRSGCPRHRFGSRRQPACRPVGRARAPALSTSSRESTRWRCRPNRTWCRASRLVLPVRSPPPPRAPRLNSDPVRPASVTSASTPRCIRLLSRVARRHIAAEPLTLRAGTVSPDSCRPVARTLWRRPEPML